MKSKPGLITRVRCHVYGKERKRMASQHAQNARAAQQHIEEQLAEAEAEIDVWDGLDVCYDDLEDIYAGTGAE